MRRGRLVVHAHFYQPSRVDPFTGRVPEDASAAPFRDWNARITEECYRPIAERGHGRPHLLEHGPDAHRRTSRPRRRRCSRGSRRPTARAAGPGSPRPSTTRSCRSPRAPTGGRRSCGASATSRCGSDGGRRRCGCPRPPWTSRRWPRWRTPGSRRRSSPRGRPTSRTSTPAGRTAWTSAAAATSRSCSTTATCRARCRSSRPRPPTPIASRASASCRAWTRRGPRAGGGEADDGDDADPLVVIATDGELYGHHQSFRDLFLQRLVAPEDPRRTAASTSSTSPPPSPSPTAVRTPRSGSGSGRRGAATTGSCAGSPSARTCRTAAGRGRCGRRWTGSPAAIDAVTDAAAGATSRASATSWAARDAYVDVVIGAVEGRGVRGGAARPDGPPRPTVAGCSSCWRRSAGAWRCSPRTGGTGTTRRGRRRGRSCGPRRARLGSSTASRGTALETRLVADLATLRSARPRTSTGARSTATRSARSGSRPPRADRGMRRSPRMASQRAGSVSAADRPQTGAAAGGHELDIERGSDVPISTQIYWQLAYQIESGRLQPGTRLPPVRELGAALRVNPNTVRAVYRRLADAGYVVGRHGAGTRVVDRPPVRRGSDALAGIVAETLRRAAQLGFTPDEVAQATFTAATEHKRPGPLVRVLFAECTSADATFDAERIVEAFPDRIEATGVLLEELPDRLARYHYDLVATTTFHADEAQAYVGGRRTGRRDARGPGLHVARPRGRGAAAGLEGGPRVRVAARRREHRRGAPAGGRDGGRDRVGGRAHGGGARRSSIATRTSCCCRARRWPSGSTRGSSARSACASGATSSIPRASSSCAARSSASTPPGRPSRPDTRTRGASPRRPVASGRRLLSSRRPDARDAWLDPLAGHADGPTAAVGPTRSGHATGPPARCDTFPMRALPISRTARRRFGLEADARRSRRPWPEPPPAASRPTSSRRGASSPPSIAPAAPESPAPRRASWPPSTSCTRSSTSWS